MGEHKHDHDHKHDHKHDKPKHDGGLQDKFLNRLREAKAPVTVFLLNGVKLQGVLTGFDNFSLMIQREGHPQLIYKHAISTVMPNGAMQMLEGPGAVEPIVENDLA